MRVFVIAGEPSGDRLGAAAMAGLKALVPGVTFTGIGGPEMARQGLDSLFPMEELSVMGLAEVLPRARHLLARVDQAARAVTETRPDILLTIDSPDFCLRVARRAKARPDRGRDVVHHADRRAVTMARVVDQVLALLPFEPPYMEAAGVPCDFVGHPVVSDPQATGEEAAAFRAPLGPGPVILALPGSRRSEVTRLAAPFGGALDRVARARPGTRVVVPAAGHVAGLVREVAAGWPGAPLVIDPADDPDGAAKRAAFRAADVALAASGTVSLELAAAGTPMVIAYDMAWLTWQIARRMVRLDTVTLVNLVSETRAVPEFIGPACRPDPISEALLATLDAPGAQRAAMETTMQRLGRDGEPPGLRAARAILARMPGQGRPPGRSG